MVTRPPGDSTSPADGAGRQHHEEAGAKLAGRHHPEIDYRIAAAQSPRDHEHERERADDRDLGDEGRAEPVVIESAIKHQLQRAEKGRDQHEADEIEPAPFPLQAPALCSRALGLAQDERDRHHGEQADWGVD
jgi:hypothetical protein